MSLDCGPATWAEPRGCQLIQGAAESAWDLDYLALNYLLLPYKHGVLGCGLGALLLYQLPVHREHAALNREDVGGRALLTDNIGHGHF